MHDPRGLDRQCTLYVLNNLLENLLASQRNASKLFLMSVLPTNRTGTYKLRQDVTNIARSIWGPELL